MSWPLYMDHHVPSVATLTLRSRGIDVLTAEEDRATRLSDDLLLERATRIGRVLVTQDRGFLSMAHEWRQAGKAFGGIIYAPQHRMSDSELASWLELCATLLREDELRDQVVFLPLN
jgi:hypothetical protein